MKVLITSGGTKIPIDTVRHVDNMSSGTFGSKIATEFLKDGHEVIFFKREHSKSPFTYNIDLFEGYTSSNLNSWYKSHEDNINSLLSRTELLENYKESQFTTFNSYFDGLKLLIERHSPDLIVLAAAVSDYGVENFVDGKIRSNDNLTIKLSPLPKVINKIKQWSPHCKLVGFKLLVNSSKEELIEASKKSIIDNGCDLVIANDLRNIKNNNHKLITVEPSLEGYIINEFENDLARVVVDKSIKLFNI